MSSLKYRYCMEDKVRVVPNCYGRDSLWRVDAVDYLTIKVVAARLGLPWVLHPERDTKGVFKFGDDRYLLLVHRAEISDYPCRIRPELREPSGILSCVEVLHRLSTYWGWLDE